MITILLAFFDAKYNGSFSVLYLGTVYLDAMMIETIGDFIKYKKGKK